MTRSIKPSLSTRTMIVFAALALLYIKDIVKPIAASSSSEALEAARFGPLPPTVFSPGGRLHGVERVARESYPSGDDESSCAVVALRCGSGDGEFAILTGIGAISPFLHRDEMNSVSQNSSNVLSTSDSYIPLIMDYDKGIDCNAPLTPISIFSPYIVAGVGGKGIDSAVLLRRAAEVSLSMHKSDDGGVEWFMSHSLEGVSANSYHVPVGGAARVEVRALARKLADLAQSATQSLGGKSGRVLSSSLFLIGLNEKTATFDLNSENNNNIIIWRVDPTGQFWSLDAGAAGRAAINIETEILNKVRKWTKKKTPQANEDESEHEISNDDVKAYLSSLTIEAALEVANDCLINGIMSSARHRNNDLQSNRVLDGSFMERGLRMRVKTAIIRSVPLGVTHTKPCIEIVRG